MSQSGAPRSPEEKGPKNVRSGKRLGLCIVGCGRFARHHAEAARERAERIELFFASRSMDRAAAYAREYGAADAFGGYEAAARDPRVEALFFCTPHFQHRADVELAASRGKHILLEKPIARTLADAEAMTAAAEQAGVRFMVAENYRYVPVIKAAAELLGQGAIGALRAVHVQAAMYDRPTGWRLSREMVGGGALIDGGIHMLSVLRMMAGEVERVSAVIPPKLFPEMEGEEGVSLWATFRGGAIGAMNFSWAALGDPAAPTCLLEGTEGQISFEFFGSRLVVGTPDGKRAVDIPGDQQGLGGMLDAFLAFVTSGETPPTTPKEAAGDLAFVLAAYESVRAHGQPVQVEPAFEKR